MIPIPWECRECGENERIECDLFATLEKIYQDCATDHKKLSPNCETRNIFVGIPNSYLDPDRAYTMEYTNGHSDEEIPMEGES